MYTRMVESRCTYTDANVGREREAREATVAEIVMVLVVVGVMVAATMVAGGYRVPARIPTAATDANPHPWVHNAQLTPCKWRWRWWQRWRRWRWQ